MGYIEPRLGFLASALGASDYMDMAALGMSMNHTLTLDGLRRTLEALTGTLWSPSEQVLDDRLSALRLQDCLGTATDPGSFHITQIGKHRLEELLRRPIQAPLSPFGQVGVRLKLSFLHELGSESRRRQIEALIRAYECEIAARSEAWSLSGPMGRQWLDHTLEGLEDGVSLLRRMARQP